MKCVRIKEMESIDPFGERGDAGQLERRISPAAVGCCYSVNTMICFMKENKDQG